MVALNGTLLAVYQISAAEQEIQRSKLLMSISMVPSLISSWYFV